MNVESIQVYGLDNASYLSPVKCADFSEAAAVCLDFHGHKSGQKIKITGDLEGEFMLIWSEVTQSMRDSRNDMEYTVESGAYCLAMLVIERLTGFKVTKQSKKRTGFDYWLGRLDALGLQDHARLEVSGILKNSKGRLSWRLKEKIVQTMKSDNLNLNAYVVVVEFSGPSIKIAKR